ncbi:MAG: DUF2125 domain-containing protein [Minwuia sp.]|uniref:DUF2125 domain-containing protein n=1 Tax=Minwuia sp. TaxID=2493630 RepID=UPI003A899DAA
MKRWIGPIIVLIVLLAAGGYWFYWSTLADGLERGFARWAEDRRAEGTEVAYSSAEVSGFPYRLELHIEQPSIEAAGLNGAPAWAADRLVLYFQTWKRGHGIAQAFGPQRIGWTEGTVRRNATVTSEQALASFRFTDRGVMTRVDTDLTQVKVAGSLPLREAERLQVHGRLRPEAGEQPHFDLSVSGTGLKVDPEASPLGENIDRYRTTVTFEPLPDSTAPGHLDAWRDAGGVLQVQAFEVATGDLSITGKGTFALDTARRAEGAATLIVRGADAFVDAVAAAGQLAGGARLGLQLGITALEETDTEGNKFVRIPIEIQDGRFKLMGFGLASVEPLY